MSKAVDYYFSVASPWTYLGSERFITMARRSGVVVNARPMDFASVLAASGGLPYQQRPPQRASYRQVDLARWRRRLGIPLTLEPRFYPVDREPASRMVVAARALGQWAALELSHAILRAIWQEDRDIADWPTLAAVAREAGLDGTALADAAHEPGIAQAWQHDTDCAIEAQVFGAPTWVVDGERFWGQDRLDFLEEKLAT
ncbi:MAG: 2-hydroxychromene-2-carboxylate isomerase [Polaromonas sp.]